MSAPPVATVLQGPGVGPRIGVPLGARLGLPAGPRQSSMALSRFFNNDVNIVPGPQPVEVTAPVSATPVKPPNYLLREFNDLVQQLPEENYDLLQTIVELLARVAVHARTTKMPLSNLLLVFCPSVGMNPSVLKLMVENHEPIFNQALLPPPSPAPSEHHSEESVVYEDINAANATSQPTLSTDSQHPRTPPPVGRIDPTELQLNQTSSLPSIQTTGVSSEAALPSQLTYLHSPAVSPEPKAEMQPLSPQPSPLVTTALSPQATAPGVPSSVSPSLTPSSSTPSSTDLMVTASKNSGLRALPVPPKPSKRIPIPYTLRPAASQSSLNSHSSSAVSMPSANPSPLITSPPAQQDPMVASPGLSDAPSAFGGHSLRPQTSFDKPLPVAPDRAEALSPISSPPPVPGPAKEEDQNSGDEADSEARPGRRQKARVVSIAPALPELESLPPMSPFASSTPTPPPPPRMSSLPPLLAPINLNAKSMFTSTIAPLKVRGHGSHPAKVVPFRPGTSSSTASSLGSGISRQQSPVVPPLVNEPASAEDGALDEQLVEVLETLPLEPQLTPLMREMEEDTMCADGDQEKTSGSEPSIPPEESRPSSAEPPKCGGSPL
jgi:hypothetical protein